jgi:hypothetical protein
MDLQNEFSNSEFEFITSITQTDASNLDFGRAVTQAVSRRIPKMAPGFESGHVGFVVEKVALGQDFCEDFGFPYQS